ncbi:CBS domain-containing protein [Phenylobacterium sp.]|uniref:CBS domain-containing protein n=1 Tax=Phenylobacterium sp. TaxID=1871053 RepID=UPI002ED83D2A
MKVRDVMHRGAECLDDDTPISDVARRMRDADVGAIPISAAGELVGIITDRDIACRAVADGADLDQLTARDVMSKDAVCCAYDDDLSDAVRIMESRRIRRLPVMADGALVGMLSLGDVASRAGAPLSAEVLRAVSSHH